MDERDSTIDRLSAEVESLRRQLADATGIVAENTRLYQALEQERARIELSEQNYRLLAEAMPQMVWTSRADGYIDYANERWCEYTGLSLEQTQASGWAAALHPDDQQATLERWLHSVRTGEIYEVIYRFRRASDGMYRWHIGRAYPLRDQDGHIAKWFGTCTDIDDQKRLAERVRFLAEASVVLSASLDAEQTLASLARLAVPALADWSGVYLVETDSGAVTLRPLILMHGDPDKVALADELIERYPPDPRTDHGLMRVAQTGQPVLMPHITEQILQGMARDAEHLRLLSELNLTSLLIVPLRARTETLGILSLALSDPTRRYTQDDVSFVQELAGRAAIAMENARLYGELQQALRTRDQFFSIAAHELKTPITSLLSYTQLLERRAQRQGGGDPQEQRTLAAIVEQTRRLHRLSLSLLDLSRIQEGSFTLDLREIDLARLLQRIVGEIQPTLDRHTLELELPADQQPVVLLGDELRLEQVFQNLIHNAIKYSPDGGPVTIFLEREETMLCVSILDHGIGIPADALPRLFTRFYRAGNVNPSQIAGMGLGLYIVRGIVSRHRGSVSVTSSEGGGSTFTICLPWQ